MLWSRPMSSATTAISVVTATLIESSVRAERSLLVRNVSSAMRTFSSWPWCKDSFSKDIAHLLRVQRGDRIEFGSFHGRPKAEKEPDAGGYDHRKGDDAKGRAHRHGREPADGASHDDRAHHADNPPDARHH